MIEKNWKELIKPAKLTVKHNNEQKSSATIIAEPIERGFGVTIGNSLRRILLSSLQGSAITSMQVQGALHEFSSLPGVREDLTDMILNIKGIKVKMDYDGVKRYCTHLIRHQMKQDVFMASMLGRLVELEALNAVFEMRKKRFRFIRKFFRRQ